MDVEKFLAATAGYERATRRPTSADRPNRLAQIDPSYNPDRYPGQNPRVVFDGEGEPTRRRWPVVGSYWPHPGDRVVMLPVGTGDWVILGSTMSADGPALHTPGPGVFGNMATGVVSFSAPDDFQDETSSAGRTASRVVEYGPLAGSGPTHVFVTARSVTTALFSVGAGSVTSTSFTVRFVDTLGPQSGTNRSVVWLAVRDLG